ncbi:HIT family protein [Terrisporobacter sp.]
MSCIFCEIKDYVLENELAYAIFDKFPATKGHMLFIPKRHVANFFDITKEEREAIFDLVNEGKKMLDEKYNPDGYNVGVNINKSGGQTVFHVHVHLMPRFKGDVVDPTGGVRGAIPKYMKYSSK